MLLQIVAWIVFGAIAGWITALTLRSQDSSEIGLNVGVGVVGALIGGFIFNSLRITAESGGFNVASLITAVIGSIMMIAVVRGFTRV